MEVHTFGEKNKPVLVLLHAFGMHWSQWNKVADGLRKKYYIIVPSLEGHEDKNRTTFSSVEHNAASITDWLINNGCSNIYGIIGISLGGSVAIKIVSMKRLKISYAIFDAGIVPLGNHGLSELFEVISNLVMFYCAHSLAVMKALSIPELYGGLDNTKVLWSTMKSISFATARNVFYGVDTYPLSGEPMENIQTNTVYWYGSFERNEREKMAVRLKKTFPDIETKMFNGYRHAQLCLDAPEQFIMSVENFIQNNNIQQVTGN
jgi:pimeloyl-ACP methyl ester carboxylesterase